MNRLLERLGRDHANLTRLLDLLDDQLSDFHCGDEPDFELMCELLEYVECYADQVHHPTEDLIFARLRERTDTHRASLGNLQDQHQTLSRMSKEFRQSLEGIVHEAVLRRDLVEAQGRDMVQLLRQHLELEEQEIFPLADDRLTEADWAVIQAQAPKLSDPVFGERDPGRFQTLYRYLTGKL